MSFKRSSRIAGSCATFCCMIWWIGRATKREVSFFRVQCLPDYALRPAAQRQVCLTSPRSFGAGRSWAGQRSCFGYACSTGEKGSVLRRSPMVDPFRRPETDRAYLLAGRLQAVGSELSPTPTFVSSSSRCTIGSGSSLRRRALSRAMKVLYGSRRSPTRFFCSLETSNFGSFALCASASHRCTSRHDMARHGTARRQKQAARSKWGPNPSPPDGLASSTQR